MIVLLFLLCIAYFVAVLFLAYRSFVAYKHYRGDMDLGLGIYLVFMSFAPIAIIVCILSIL